MRMTPVTFKTQEQDYTLILEHIAFYCGAQYDSELLTEITMISGHTITVLQPPHEVALLFRGSTLRHCKS